MLRRCNAELNGALTRHLLGSAWSREEKRSSGKSYPLDAFQIALQQRVQSEDHVVAEALELEDDTNEDKVKLCEVRSSVWMGWTEQEEVKGLRTCISGDAFQRGLSVLNICRVEFKPKFKAMMAKKL